MSAEKDSDPFFKSMATLKKLLSSPPQESTAPRRSSLGRRRSSSPVVATTNTTALRLEIEQERKQRHALEKALEALTDSRKTLQSQLEAAKEEAKRKEQAYTVMQGEVEEIKEKHAAEIKQEQEKVSEAKMGQKKALESLDAAEARVASLELHLQELQGELKKKEEMLKQVHKNQQDDRAMMQKNVDILLADLKKTRTALAESKKRAEVAAKEAEAKEKAGMTKAGEGVDTRVNNDTTAAAPEMPKKRPLEDAEGGEESLAKKKSSSADT